MRAENATTTSDVRGPDAFRRLIRDCLRTPGAFAGAVASMLGLSLTQLYLTWIAKRWVEEGLAAHDPAAITRLMLLAAGVSSLMVLALFGAGYWLASLNQSLVAALRERAQRRILRARLACLRGFAGGDLMSRVFNDSAAVSGFAESLLKRVIGEGFLVLGAVSMMLYLEWRLAIAAFVAAPPIVWLVTRLGRVIRQRGAHAQRELGTLSALFAEQIAGFTTIKSFQAEDFEGARFHAQNESYREGVMRSEWWSSALFAAVWLLTSFGLLFVVGYGSELVISGRLTEGAVLSFCLYAIQTIEPVRRISEVYGRLQRTLAAAERVYELIDLPWVEDGGTHTLARPVHGALRLDRVSFAYRPDAPVLEDISVEIHPGERVAVVAASGGGKSTLAALLCRFYDPTGGRVLVDGVDVRELSLEGLRRIVCTVEQEPFLFAGTLFDNVRYGSWQTSRAAVESALEDAGLGRWLAQMSGGLDAHLAEGGRNLSGGQKQRIVLARAIVRDPRILILDEATSALDSEIEAQIFAEIRPWLRERTVLVMAHRLATVVLCPRVLLLADGRLVADGSVEELRAGCPPFVQLFADQMLSYDEAPTGAGARPTGAVP